MDNMQKVPYIVYESAMTRNERNIKRLVIALIISIIMIFASNIAWLLFFNQYEYSTADTETVTVDGKNGNANYIGDDGDIKNGKDSSEENSDKNNEEEKRQE